MRMTRKKTTILNDYYAFTLDDYGTISFVSGSKTYFGTLNDFERLLINDKNKQFVEPFNMFKNGSTDVVCDVAYNKEKFATPVKILDFKVKEIEGGRYNHENIYGFPYIILFDKLVETRYLVHYGKEYYIAYKLQITNMAFEDEFSKNGYYAILDFWGFPSMIQNISKNKSQTLCENVLMEVESVYKTRQEAEEIFSSKEQLDYKAFFNDVFGDG